jgi:hypothetical protein
MTIVRETKKVKQEKKDKDYCRRRSPSREKGEKSTVCPCVHEGWGEYETGQDPRRSNAMTPEVCRNKQGWAEKGPCDLATRRTRVSFRDVTDHTPCFWRRAPQSTGATHGMFTTFTGQGVVKRGRTSPPDQEAIHGPNRGIWRQIPGTRISSIKSDVRQDRSDLGARGRAGRAAPM